MTMETVSANPTKSFFVEMLTRDISLEEAILDLLDNCVDGIQRATGDGDNAADKPYSKFWAKIDLSKDSFCIEDNCGGIPKQVAEQYAFRMGRPQDKGNVDSEIYTVGTYGIGMKRAIFKMGRAATVTSHTDSSSFEVSINPDWLDSDSDWDLPCQEVERDSPETENGTKIQVFNLNEAIASEFSSSESTIVDDLIGRISRYYSYILGKGFSISVNSKPVSARKLEVLWETNSKDGGKIEPFLYEANIDDVDIHLAVGLYRNIPDEDELEDELSGNPKRRNENAGWTIICNDRVVVYCDKTILTGWGDAGVPKFHPQYIGISGIVEFRSKDSRKLPVTTTKSGIDASSEIYLRTKNLMREGLKLFTSYTNKWRSNADEGKTRLNAAERVDSTKIFDHKSGYIQDKAWKQVRNRKNEKKYIPSLPEPYKVGSSSMRKKIVFYRLKSEIEIVAEYLFENPKYSISEVGSECFEKVLEQAEEEI